MFIRNFPIKSILNKLIAPKYRKATEYGNMPVSALFRFEVNGDVFRYVTYDWQVSSRERSII